MDETDNGYGDSQGNLDLREAIVQREYEKHGIHITPEDVYVTAGVSECINIMMGTLIEPGDEVLVPGPGYPSYAQYINFYEGRTVAYRQIEDEDWRPDTDMIRKRITNRTKAMVVINPNNPTGAIYDEKAIREIGDISAEYDIPLISDEIYDKIVMEGDYFSASQLPDDVPRVIFNGFSKVNLMPGWRMGYCYFMDKYGLMDEVREGMMKQFRARICANVPCQAAARASLQGPQDYIVDLNRKLRERSEFTYKRLNEIPGISTNRVKGGLRPRPHRRGGRRAGPRIRLRRVRRVPLQDHHPPADVRPGGGVRQARALPRPQGRLTNLQDQSRPSGPLEGRAQPPFRPVSGALLDGGKVNPKNYPARPTVLYS